MSSSVNSFLQTSLRTGWPQAAESPSQGADGQGVSLKCWACKTFAHLKGIQSTQDLSPTSLSQTDQTIYKLLVKFMKTIDNRPNSLSNLNRKYSHLSKNLTAKDQSGLLRVVLEKANREKYKPLVDWIHRKLETLEEFDHPLSDQTFQNLTKGKYPFEMAISELPLMEQTVYQLFDLAENEYENTEKMDQILDNLRLMAPMNESSVIRAARKIAVNSKNTKFLLRLAQMKLAPESNTIFQNSSELDLLSDEEEASRSSFSSSIPTWVKVVGVVGIGALLVSAALIPRLSQRTGSYEDVPARADVPPPQAPETSAMAPLQSGYGMESNQSLIGRVSLLQELQPKVHTQEETNLDSPLNNKKLSRLEILQKEIDDMEAALFKNHPFTQEDYFSRADGSINEEAETRTLGRIQRGEFGEDFPRSGDSNYLSALSFAFLIDQVIENKSYDNFVINNPKSVDFSFSFSSEEQYEKFRAICTDKTKIRNLGEAVKYYHLNEKIKTENLKSDPEMLKLPKDILSLPPLYNDYLYLLCVEHTAVIKMLKLPKNIRSLTLLYNVYLLGVKNKAANKRLLENEMKKNKTAIIIFGTWLISVGLFSVINQAFTDCRRTQR